MTRRAFLPALGLAGGLGLGWFARTRSASRPASDALLRPPGAETEREFLAACIRCGQCVEACPSGTLSLATVSAGLSSGTPYVPDTREAPCTLCQGYESLNCIDVCPTEALKPLAEWNDIRMGVAILDRDRCFAFNGTTCRACWHACPFPNEAIKLDWKMRPDVVADTCIGCGLCVRACLTEESSISIRPTEAFKPGEATFVGAGAV